MNDEKIPINRHLVSAIAVGCLLAGAYLATNSSPDANNGLWPGAFVRVGILMLAFWLTLPTKKRPAAWSRFSPGTIAIAVAVLVMFARSPKLALMIALPAFAILFLLSMFVQPKEKYRPPRNSD